jgi:cytoskeletal protein RodZ
MGSIGEFFKHVRETKRLTMDEVAMKTRIHPEFLKALEEENFAKLPDQVFVKGFVRSYARSLGLDEEEAIRRFDESSGAFYTKQDERERLRVKQVEDERRRKANKKAVAVVAGVGLVCLALMFTKEQSTLVTERPPSVRETPRPVPAPPPVKPVETAAKSEGTEAAEVRPVTQAGQTKPSGNAAAVSMPPGPERPATAQAAPSPPTPPAIESRPPGEEAAPEPLKLDLHALELTWVLVQVDDGLPQEALMKRGDRANWVAQEKFVVTLGNAGGVQVDLNGKPQGPFGPSGKVVRDIVLLRP